MDERRVDGRIFFVEAAQIFWSSLVEGINFDQPTTHVPRNPFAVAAGNIQPQVALRWHVNAAAGFPDPDMPIGLPDTPFTVWRRSPKLESDGESRIDFINRPGPFPGTRLIQFARPMAKISVEVNSVAGGLVFALSNSPKALSVLKWDIASAGNDVLRMAAGRINGLLIPSAMGVNSLLGIEPEPFIDADDWEPIEIVGLPVDPGEWAGVGSHGDKQGPIDALVDPPDAAIDRLLRGTPPFGWPTEVEPGVLAPPWQPPDPGGILDEVHEMLIPQLRETLQRPRSEHADFEFESVLPPPETLDGNAMNADDQTALVKPVSLLQLAVSGDPFLSLGLGYGTNLIEETFGDNQAIHDYMVTAKWGEITMAALALTPASVFRPVAPTDMITMTRADVSDDDALTEVPAAQLPPTVIDGPWRASTTTRWERPFEAALVRTASHMVARRDVGDPVATSLVEERESGGHHPVVPTSAADDAQQHFIHYADRQFEIANDPGARSLRYSATNQNIFGVWSQWQNSQATVVQPPAAPPQIMAADLAVTAPAAGTACPAELTVELIWDWSDRSPDQITLVGRMFASPDRSTDVPVAIAPAGFARDLGAIGAAVSLSFSGDTALLAGAPPGSTITYLNEQGEKAVAAGADQGSGPRRYRILITGLTVDFAATDHAGYAIWAQGTELIAPQRNTITASPFQTYASTPIAPAVPAELVPLSSLPDAQGSSHARVSWTAAPGAESYTVYGSDESTMRSHYGLGEPALEDTLSDRVTELLDAWEAAPDRRPFTRLTPRPVYETSIDIALPRGMTGISTFVIVSTSAGQVQGPWPVVGPTLRDDLILRATPRVARPATPEIEAIADGDDVRLTVRTRPGHRVGRVDIHRVRVGDAARELDTMGPPIATVAVGTPGWTSELDDDDDTPLSFSGVDNPGTSWRRVWYRAVAWADDEWPVDGAAFPYQIAERGLVAGRSESSNAVSVAVPPPGPPDLSDLEISWPGGSVADVLLSWTTDVPFEAPLGVHRIEVDVRADGEATPLLSYSGPLGGIGINVPPSGDALFRVDGSDPAEFQALIRRLNVDIELDATVTIIDPLGRSQQRTAHVDAGSVLPPPDLGDLDVFTIAGRGTVLTFTSSAPIVELGGQAYRLTVAVHPQPSTPTVPPITIPPVLIPPGGRPAATPGLGGRPGGRGSIRPGRLTPVARDRVAAVDAVSDGIRIDNDPTDLLDLTGTTIELPDGLDLSDVFGPRPRPITVNIDLPDILLDRGQSATREAVQVRRQRGGGPIRSYSVFAPFDVDHFELTLRSPDGRVAKATTEDRR